MLKDSPKILIIITNNVVRSSKTFFDQFRPIQKKFIRGKHKSCFLATFFQALVLLPKSASGQNRGSVRSRVFFVCSALVAQNLFVVLSRSQGEGFFAHPKIFRLRRAAPNKIFLSRACRGLPPARQRDKKKP